jgi:hypothetical protein
VSEMISRGQHVAHLHRVAAAAARRLRSHDSSSLESLDLPARSPWDRLSVSGGLGDPATFCGG